MPSKNSIEVLQREIDFLLFWRWEYGRRATNFNRELFEDFVNGGFKYLTKKSAWGTALCRFEFPLKSIWVTPGECDCYVSSSEMLDDFLKHSFSYKLERSFAVVGHSFHHVLGGNWEGARWLEGIPGRYGLSAKRCVELFQECIEAIEKLRGGQVFFLPDFMDEEEIAINLRAARNSPPDDEDDPFYGDPEVEKMAELQRQKMYLMNFSSLSKIPSEAGDVNRAVGLWLWDYVNVNGCKPAEAIRTLSKEYDLVALGLEMKDDSAFRTFFTKTKECIEENRIVSFKPRSRKKREPRNRLWFPER